MENGQTFEPYILNLFIKSRELSVSRATSGREGGLKSKPLKNNDLDASKTEASNTNTNTNSNTNSNNQITGSNQVGLTESLQGDNTQKPIENQVDENGEFIPFGKAANG